MGKKLRWIIGIAVVFALALVLGQVDNRLYWWVFNQTGEEELDGQVRGMVQLPLNLVQHPLQTALNDEIEHIEIAHTGVNPYGVNTFLHHEVEIAKREEQLRLISDAGFHWIRQEFPWEDIEIHGRGDFVDRRNNPDGVDAWEKYDNIVELSEQYNVEIIARLSNPPAWSREAGDSMGTYAPPDDTADFANFVAAVAERYQGQITYYQIWNEPNIYPEWGEYPVDPEAYTELLCQAYEAIKAVDPDAVILSGALAPTAELSSRDLNDFIFLQRMYNAGAGDCFDVLTMQGYGLWSGPTDRRMRPLVVNYGRNQYIRDIMVRNGDEHKAIWISEMNWNVAPEDVNPAYGRATLDQQARWGPLAYQRAQEEWPWIGVINMWYFKRASDDWLSERRPEAYFQMLEPDFTPLPVYESMADFANQPPVMYPGNHAADHWAVESGDGETSFKFSGTSLRVIASGEGTLSYQVDGGNITTVEHGFLWQGRRGKHTITIETTGDIMISRYIIHHDPNLALPVLMVLSLVFVIGWAAGKQENNTGD